MRGSQHAVSVIARNRLVQQHQLFQFLGANRLFISIRKLWGFSSSLVYPCTASNTLLHNILSHEAYFPLHPDMSYYHIWQRQPLGTPVPTTKQRNMMNDMRLRKARIPHNARRWTRKRRYPPRILVELVEGLSQTQLLLNTTWIVTPRAIIQPGTDRRLPLNIYLDGHPAHTPSIEVRAALAQSHRLQALARSHHVAHWSELPRDLLPNAWFGRARAKQPQGTQITDSSSDDTPESEESSEQSDETDNMESDDSIEGDDEAKEMMKKRRLKQGPMTLISPARRK